MNAMILAAGLGTRLRPWTLEHPKALVPVDGVPMLERVIFRLRDSGINHILINIHHFGEQIVEFVASREWGVTIDISDERGMLLDTGGGIAKGCTLLRDEAPLLVHNVDIISNADLRGLVETHLMRQDDITLLTSRRGSSRQLMFNSEEELKGWHNLTTGEYRLAADVEAGLLREEAFSGIYVLGRRAIADLQRYSESRKGDGFPIMDYFLGFPSGLKMRKVTTHDLRVLDIGKPESLANAERLLNEMSEC